MEEIGKVGYAERMAACDVGAEWSAPRKGGVARMATFILDAVDPSVDSSGLTRCCRHEVCIRIRFGEMQWSAGPWMEMDADHQPASVDEALREISGSLFLEFEVGMSRRGRTP